MQRASNAFSVLQAIAATAILAVILWSVGLPSLRFAEAAAVTNYSDTLSTSEPSVAADHTIVFTLPSGVPNTGTISIDLSAFSGTSSIVASDITVATTSALTVGATCGAVDVAVGFTLDTLVLTMCSTAGGFVAANGTTTVQIGTGGNQLINPTALAGGYAIPLTTSAGDSGETRVAILDTVQVTATVDTVFNFTVAGVAAGQTVNGTTTGTTTTATLIGFGTLQAGVATTGAQDLTVETNAANGFTVTVIADGMLTAGLSDIDGFANGNYTSSPTAWSSPLGTVGSEETYGHWGLTSDDTDYFPTAQTYVSASTTPVEIYTHDGPVNGATAGEGTTRVGYTVEISALQEAADNYTATLTYVATPVF